jgi:hypothetical protein
MKHVSAKFVPQQLTGAERSCFSEVSDMHEWQKPMKISKKNLFPKSS